MRLLPIALVAAALIVVPLAAQDVPLPEPRPETAVPQGEEIQQIEGDESEVAVEGDVPLPRPRPETEPETVETEADGVPVEGTEGDEPAEESADDAGPVVEPNVEPEPEEPRIYQAACPVVLMGRVDAEALPPISEGGCREQSPLSVTAVLVHGRMVPLTSPTVMNCEMASTLPDWAEAIDGYLMAKENTQLSGIAAGTGYMCRNRNNAETGDVSEHGFANAFDVVGVTLEDGRSVNVEAGWADALSSEGRLLRFAHDSACSMFTTTLGPEANELHHDHLHLDLGCHGSTCTARLCE